MKTLIIGAGGFVGSYLIEELLSRGWEVCATKLPAETIPAKGSYETADLDILSEDDILKLISQKKPASISAACLQKSDTTN